MDDTNYSSLDFDLQDLAKRISKQDKSKEFQVWIIGTENECRAQLERFRLMCEKDAERHS